MQSSGFSIGCRHGLVRRSGWLRGRAVPLGTLLFLLTALLAGCGRAPELGRPSGAGAVTVTDIVGRTVQVKAPVERIVLGEARLAYLIAVLERDDPFKRIVGWPNDLRVNDFDAYNKYHEKFPKIAEIPELGAIAGGAFSVEKAIELKPNLVVLSYDNYGPARETGLIEKFEKVGIPSVVIDFRQQPLENTVPSTHLLGRLLGQTERAQQFADYYIRQVNLVHSRVESLKPPYPLVFLARGPGINPPGSTFGRGNFGWLVERAGGNNLGSSKIPGWSGVLSPEEILASNPEIVIATGSNWSLSPNKQADLQFVGLGYQTKPDEARAQLLKLTEQPGWANLAAVRNRKLYAVWHQFYNSPYHFVVFQQFAKWIHPDRFTDLDPEQTFREFHEQFLPISYSGTFMLSVGE